MKYCVPCARLQEAQPSGDLRGSDGIVSLLVKDCD